MKNSWGQEISVGSVVYRGARQGNSSEYKVGVVQTVNPDKPPRVKWMFETSTRWVMIDDQRKAIPSIWKPSRPSSGSPSLESLVVVDFDIEELERRAAFFSALKSDVRFSSRDEFQHALDTFNV